MSIEVNWNVAGIAADLHGRGIISLEEARELIGLPSAGKQAVTIEPCPPDMDQWTLDMAAAHSAFIASQEEKNAASRDRLGEECVRLFGQHRGPLFWSVLVDAFGRRPQG